jgi:hypothetical protein
VRSSQHGAYAEHERDKHPGGVVACCWEYGNFGWTPVDGRCLCDPKTMALKKKQAQQGGILLRIRDYHARPERRAADASFDAVADVWVDRLLSNVVE